MITVYRNQPYGTACLYIETPCFYNNISLKESDTNIFDYDFDAYIKINLGCGFNNCSFIEINTD